MSKGFKALKQSYSGQDIYGILVSVVKNKFSERE
jgi:hypothetical protein